MLDSFETIPVAVGYEVDGEFTSEMPVLQQDFVKAVPVYQYLPGWQSDITRARKFADLPKEAQDYVKFLEEQAGCRISAIGVGPGREATILRHRLV